MSSNHKYSNYVVDDSIPPDLQKAIQSFIEQAIIIDEYHLDYMPSEYYINLIEAVQKYPEYQDLLVELLNGIGITIEGIA